MAYITQADLENVLGAQVVRALYDEDNSGDADAGPIAALIRAASAKVNSFVRRLYALPLPEPAPDIIWSLTLDVACAMAKERHPEVVRVDGAALMKRADADLALLRDGKIELDIPKLPKALNEQAILRPAGAAVGEPQPRMFADGVGDFAKLSLHHVIRFHPRHARSTAGDSRGHRRARAERRSRHFAHGRNGCA